MFKVAPLSSSFLVVSIFGFLASFFYSDYLGVTWGFLFMLFFSILFISAVISMTHTTVDADLAIHEKHHVRRYRKNK